MDIRRFIGSKAAALKGVIRKGAFHIFLGSFITKFAAFFGSVFIVRVLTKEDYGILGYVENLFNYAYVLAGMGLVNALLRYVVLAKEKEGKLGYYRYVIRFSSIFNVILMAAAAVLFVFYPHPEKFASAQWLLPLLMLSLPFRSLFDNQNGLQRAMFDNKRYAFWGCLVSVNAVAVKFVLSWLFGIEGAVVSTIAVYAVFAGVLALYIHRIYFTGVMPTPLDRPQKREVNKYSIQYMITNSIWTIFMLNDVFLLGQLTGNAALVADYKVAYVLPANLSLISASIGVFVAPYFVKHETEPAWIKRTYGKVFGVSALLIGLAAAVLFICAQPIISLLYGENYITTVPVMRVLLIAAFINTALRYTNANLLAAMGHIRPNMLVSLAGVLLQIGINVFMIPAFGVMGVAWTSVMVYAGMAVALMLVFWRKILRKKADRV